MVHQSPDFFPVKLSKTFWYIIILMHAISHGGCTDTGRESAPEVDSGKKSLAAPGTRTRANIAPGFSIRRSTNSAIPASFVRSLSLAKLHSQYFKTVNWHNEITIWLTRRRFNRTLYQLNYLRLFRSQPIICTAIQPLFQNGKLIRCNNYQTEWRREIQW